MFYEFNESHYLRKSIDLLNLYIDTADKNLIIITI